MSKISNQCAVCQHISRVEVELALAGGAGQKAVAQKYGLNKYSVHRHWNRHVDAGRKARLLVGPVQQHALAARISEENSNVLDQLRTIRAGLFESYDVALRVGDRNSTALLASKLHENLRITGGITGELANSPLTQYNTVVNNNLSIRENQEFVQLKADLTRVLQRHPAALSDVIAEFERMDALPALEHNQVAA